MLTAAYIAASYWSFWGSSSTCADSIVSERAANSRVAKRQARTDMPRFLHPRQVPDHDDADQGEHDRDADRERRPVRQPEVAGVDRADIPVVPDRGHDVHERPERDQRDAERQRQ